MDVDTYNCCVKFAGCFLPSKNYFSQFDTFILYINIRYLIGLIYLTRYLVNMQYIYKHAAHLYEELQVI